MFVFTWGRSAFRGTRLWLAPGARFILCQNLFEGCSFLNQVDDVCGLLHDSLVREMIFILQRARPNMVSWELYQAAKLTMFFPFIGGIFFLPRYVPVLSHVSSGGSNLLLRYFLFQPFRTPFPTPVLLPTCLIPPRHGWGIRVPNLNIQFATEFRIFFDPGRLRREEVISI